MDFVQKIILVSMSIVLSVNPTAALIINDREKIEEIFAVPNTDGGQTIIISSQNIQTRRRKSTIITTAKDFTQAKIKYTVCDTSIDSIYVHYDSIYTISSKYSSRSRVRRGIFRLSTENKKIHYTKIHNLNRNISVVTQFLFANQQKASFVITRASQTLIEQYTVNGPRYNLKLRRSISIPPKIASHTFRYNYRTGSLASISQMFTNIGVNKKRIQVTILTFDGKKLIKSILSFQSRIQNIRKNIGLVFTNSGIFFFADSVKRSGAIGIYSIELNPNRQIEKIYEVGTIPNQQIISVKSNYRTSRHTLLSYKVRNGYFLSTYSRRWVPSGQVSLISLHNAANLSALRHRTKSSAICLSERGISP